MMPLSQKLCPLTCAIGFVVVACLGHWGSRELSHEAAIKPYPRCEFSDPAGFEEGKCGVEKLHGAPGHSAEDVVSKEHNDAGNFTNGTQNMGLHSVSDSSSVVGRIPHRQSQSPVPLTDPSAISAGLGMLPQSPPSIPATGVSLCNCTKPRAQQFFDCSLLSNVTVVKHLRPGAFKQVSVVELLGTRYGHLFPLCRPVLLPIDEFGVGYYAHTPLWGKICNTTCAHEPCVDAPQLQPAEPHIPLWVWKSPRREVVRSSASARMTPPFGVIRVAYPNA